MLRSSTEAKISSATRPTKPAAIHSIVSMKRSMKWRVMSRSGAARDAHPPLRRQRIVLGERGFQLAERGIRIDACLTDALAPGLDQRLGGLLPLRGLFRRQRVDVLACFRLHLVEARVFEFAPGCADAACG